MKSHSLEEHKKAAIGIILIGGIVVGFLLNEFIFIRMRIFYSIEYNVPFSNSEEIIDRAESFDYIKYLLIHRSNDLYNNGIYNNSKFNDQYIDGEYLNHLKEAIDQDALEFHWWPFYGHSFTYTFSVSNHTRLYLTYDNDSIFQAQYENLEEIFPVAIDHSGNWYINFTQVPYVPGSSSKVSLNNSILVSMKLDYDLSCGSLCGAWYEIDQYVVLDSNLQVTFVYVPIVAIMVS